MEKKLSEVIIKHLMRNAVSILLLLVILIFLVYISFNIKSEKNDRNIMDILNERLAKFDETAALKGQYPRITVLTKEFLQSAKSQNLTFFDKAKEGDFLLEYLGTSVIYDYDKDQIVNSLTYELIPNDLLIKLTTHKGLDTYTNVNPISIIKLDEATLKSYQDYFPDIYQNAKVGQYVVRYEDRLMVYDYDNDVIIQNRPVQPASEQLPRDFFTKLYTHSEVANYKDQSPSGGKLDDETIKKLQENNPGYYKEAKPGDYLLRYSDMVVIYRYEEDTIIAQYTITATPP